MSLTKNLYWERDHVQRALNRVLESDKSRAKFLKLISIWAERIQTLEDVFQQMYNALDLDSATGEALDRLGAIVGEAREGRSDATYRYWIRARARANRSAGRINDLLAVLKLVVEDTADITYTEIPDRDAEYLISILGTSVPEEQLRGILETVRPAGVLGDILIGSGTGPFFAFDGPDGTGFNEGSFVGV